MDRRFAWGVGLIIASIFLGVVFKFYILAKAAGTTSFDWLSIRSYLGDPVLEIATAIYILSWPMLFLGIYLCGKQGVKYAERFTKYMTYRYYHRQAKKHVPRITRKSVRETHRLVKKTGRIVKRGHRQTRRLFREGLRAKKPLVKS